MWVWGVHWSRYRPGPQSWAPLSALFLGECPPLVQTILVFWVMNYKSKCAYINYHVRNKRFWVQHHSSMTEAIVCLRPLVGKVNNPAVICGKINEKDCFLQNQAFSLNHMVSGGKCSLLHSLTQTELWRDLGTHSSADWSFCKYFLNDLCRQKPQVRCGWKEKGRAQHLSLNPFYFP